MKYQPQKRYWANTGNGGLRFECPGCSHIDYTDHSSLQGRGRWRVFTCPGCKLDWVKKPHGQVADLEEGNN